MWKCPVCQTENDNLICKKCGFDESQNYVRHASLFALTPEMIAKAQRQWMAEDSILSERFPASFSEIMTAGDFDSLLKQINVKVPFQSGKYQINASVLMQYDMEKRHYELSNSMTNEKLIYDAKKSESWTIIFGRFPKMEDGDELFKIIKKYLTDDGRKTLEDYDRTEKARSFKRISFTIDGWKYALVFPAETGKDGGYWKLKKTAVINKVLNEDKVSDSDIWFVPQDDGFDDFSDAHDFGHGHDSDFDSHNHDFNSEFDSHDQDFDSDSGKAKFMKFKVDKDTKKPDDFGDISGGGPKIKSTKVLYCTECGKPTKYVCKDGLVCKRCGRLFIVDAKSNVQEVSSDTKHPYFLLLFEAEKYRNAGLYNKELGILRKVLKKYGMTTFVLTKMGRAYRTMQNYAKAMDCYRRALAIDPEDGLIYSNMGVLCYVQGSYDTAIYYYRQAMSLMDEHDTEFPTFLANYALALGTVGEKERAEFMLNRAQSLGYKNADVMRQKLGY